MRMSFRAATALGTSLVGLIPVGAHAAPFDWSGFYLGINGGVVQQEATGTATYPDNVTGTGFSFSGNNLYYGGTLYDSDLPTLFTLGARGQSVGAAAGYNFTSGNLVYGVEGDFNLVNKALGSQTLSTTSGDTTVNFSSRLDWLATLRARAGISADRLLLFATAGLAAGQSSLSSDFSYYDTGKAALRGSTSAQQLGYVVGGGAEYAVSERVTLKGQALYFNLGDTSLTAVNDGSTDSINTPVSAEPYTATFSQSGVIVSAGVNVQF